MSPDDATPTELEEAKAAEEVTPKKSMKERFAFMGKGGEKMDKVPVINKVPRSMRVLMVIIIVVLLVVVVAAAMMLMGGEDKPNGGTTSAIDPAKLDDLDWASGPVAGSASEFSESSTTLDTVMGANQTVLVDSITMTLEWQDEPDQTWAGRVRENTPDSFQLRIELGNQTYSVQSEMTPNDANSKQGSVSVTLNVAEFNMSYVAVGMNVSNMDLPEDVGFMGISLVIIMGEAGDLYASGPAAFKLNDFGNDYTLNVSATGKVIPADMVNPE